MRFWYVLLNVVFVGVFVGMFTITPGFGLGWGLLFAPTLVGLLNLMGWYINRPPRW